MEESVREERSRAAGIEIFIFFASEEPLRQGDITDLDVLVGPLVEQLDAANLGHDVLGQSLVAGDGLDLDLSVVRHVGGCALTD